MILFGIAGLAVFAAICYCVIWPVVEYFVDRKGLRKYPKLHPLSGISYIPFLLESQRGFRSQTLLALHSKGHPVIRVGPDSLSFSSIRAIKVSVPSPRQPSKTAIDRHCLGDIRPRYPDH
jgi:hypothetical protein